MTDYISREAAINVALTYRNTHDMTLIPGSYMTGFKCGAEQREYDIVSGLQILPTADVAPVRHGTWLPIVETNEDGSPYQAGVYCSECGHCDCVETNYCQDCGAIMDGGQKKFEAQKRDLENARRSMEEAIETPVVDVTRWQYPQLTKEAKQKV